MINGIINVYKEPGYTSFDVVARLRGICKQKKIGHTGTLDPDASGVLPVCLGSGTKLCDMLTDRSKEYQAVLLLGQVTDTQDTSGTVLSVQPVEVSKEEVKEAILSFLGEYDQIPPMYSALKVDGKRLYELARAGKEVERKPRKVVIDKLEITDISLPYVTMTVGCSKGTYIRTLCHDIGQKLGCGGTMAKLVRTRVGSFLLEDALKLDELEAMSKEGTLSQKVISVDAMFSMYPAVVLSGEKERLVQNGNPFTLEKEKMPRFDTEKCVRVYNAEDRFFGIYQYIEKEKRFKPVKMFL